MPTVRDAAPDRREILLLIGVGLGGGVILPWLTSSFGLFPHFDAVIHLLSGIALALIGAYWLPRGDVGILILVTVLAVIWEPLEAWYFSTEIVPWMLREDTLFDIALAFVGATVTLIGLRRLT